MVASLNRISSVAITFGVAIASLCGCDEPGSTVGLMVNGKAADCAGLVRSTSFFGKNGTGIRVHYSSANFLSKEETRSENIAASRKRAEYSAPSEDFEIGWDAGNFVAQSNPNICWAATLSMAFKHLDFHYTQEEFVQVNQDRCSDKSATLPQIVHALTSVHLNEGIWYTDPPKQSGNPWPFSPMTWGGMPAVPMIGTFQRIGWKTTYRDGKPAREGAVVPLYNTSDVLGFIANKMPVVVGYKVSGRRHVALLVGARARIGGLVLSDGSLHVMPGNNSVRIETLSVVDPLGDGRPLTMLYDSILEKPEFVFGIWFPLT